MARFIIFLIRLRLGLKKHEKFRFTNQKNPDHYYYFTKRRLMKYDGKLIRFSNVSLNWILDKKCKIEILKDEAEIEGGLE